MSVTAVEPGTAGNVEPNTIVDRPEGRGPAGAQGHQPGRDVAAEPHEEFPQVTQEDVDGALDQLATALDARSRRGSPTRRSRPPGATVFPETAVLGEPTPTVDPTTLVGQEVETFELGLTATGTVVTVDPAPVAAIADAAAPRAAGAGPRARRRLDRRQGRRAGRRRADRSRFSATATGQEVAVLDPPTLRTLILGKPLDEARASSWRRTARSS